MTIPELVISDASCLIALDEIGEILLLQKVFLKITVTEEVAAEYGKPIPSWCRQRKVSSEKTKEICRLGLGLGESSAIALAEESNEETYLLLDDRAARKEALRRGLNITGVVGVLLRAKEAGVVDAVEPYLNRLKANGFRLSDTLIQKTLHEAGET